MKLIKMASLFFVLALAINHTTIAMSQKNITSPLKSLQEICTAVVYKKYENDIQKVKKYNSIFESALRTSNTLDISYLFINMAFSALLNLPQQENVTGRKLAFISMDLATTVQGKKEFFNQLSKLTPTTQSKIISQQK